MESRFEALRSEATQLVGRDEELDLLMRHWQQAKAGEGQVVLVSGEPGIGKSRLAEAFRLSLEADLHTRLRYFGSPHHQDSALFPFIAQLERAAGFEREDSPSARLDRASVDGSSPCDRPATAPLGSGGKRPAGEGDNSRYLPAFERRVGGDCNANGWRAAVPRRNPC